MLKVSGFGSRHKKRAKVVTDNDWRNENKVPVVSNGRELIEKVVEHFFFFFLMKGIKKTGTEV